MSARLSADTAQNSYQLPSDAQVIGYLLQSVTWYRHVYSERQVANEPADLMFLDDDQATERQIDLQTQRFTGHVATFSNSLVFVSPATGLVKFDSAPEKIEPEAASKSGTEPELSERASVAGTRS